MKTSILIALNAALVLLFVYLWRRKNLLATFEGGKWYLTWIAVAVITLMDELTSIYYAPAEAHRFIGTNAIFFIAFTSLLIRLVSTRLTEIARILEKHGIKGGGVYSFSYLVLGPVMSFIAVASIVVDYILTASISTVSAVENAHSVVGFNLAMLGDLPFQMAIVWGVCLLNIAGIRESARFTFAIFTAAAFILLTLIASGIVDMPTEGWGIMASSFTSVGDHFASDSILAIGHNIVFIVVGISSCILAYSGVESVLQTAGLVRNWHDIRRSYLFLGLTVGVVTPLISAIALSFPGIDYAAHEGDLITHLARLLNGPWFALTVGALASFTLTMAVNTAYVASAELVEQVAHRYDFAWIVARNKRGSLHRIHLANAALYTIVILATQGSQKILAEMYAVGLVASFVINMGSLLIYRYRRGTLLSSEPGDHYKTSRIVTLLLFLLLFACFSYLAYEKPYGLAMWLLFTVVSLIVGLRVARKRAPEIRHRSHSDTPMELILFLAESDAECYDIYFRRPQEHLDIEPGSAYVSFYSPRTGVPDSHGYGHFRFASERVPLRDSIARIIELVRYELPGKRVVFHFGWPVSSWFDRLSTGVMVYSLMRLPRQYPEFEFKIEYAPRSVWRQPS
jgi:amino acid transporter